MKLINSKVYLSIKEVVECGISTEGSLWTAKSKGTKCWDFVKDESDLRNVWIGYDAMSDERKRLVELRFGNPYDRVARTPILDMVVNDRKANEYYMAYRYDGLKNLPISRVYQYTRAVSWLAMLDRALVDKRIIKKDLGLTVPEFFIHVGELINLERSRGKTEGYAGIDVLPADFPGTYQRLLAKVERYRTEGYDMLIDPLFGNKIGAKIGKIPFDGAQDDSKLMLKDGGNGTKNVAVSGENDPNMQNKRGAFDLQRYEDQMAVIRYCAEKGNNLDAGQVAKMSNIVFERKGWKTISRATVNKIISENMHLLTAGRQGKKVYGSKVAMQMTRKVTPMPLMYWTLDGWTVELAFQQRGDKGVEYKRMVAVIVLDVHKKYPVGYAVGERETANLIRQANRNAIMHVKELFGAYYVPWQVQSDNYQIKNLTPFYQAMTHLHTPAEVGNAKAKVIEPYFKDLNKNYCQYMPNWCGFNINAEKDNQVNREWLDKVKHTFPDRAGVLKQIEMIISSERNKKLGEYKAGMAKWHAAGAEQDNTPEIITEIGWLRVFGKPLGDRTNSITGQGIIKQINGVEYIYDSFDAAFRANRHIDWQLIGDEHDLSRVLAVSPDKKLQFVLAQKRIVPMDVRSTMPEDREYRSRVAQFNDDREEEITELYGADAERVRGILADVPWETDDMQELAMKAMFTVQGRQKEGIQDAKRLGVAAMQKQIAKEQKVAAGDWEQLQEQFISGSRINFNG